MPRFSQQALFLVLAGFSVTVSAETWTDEGFRIPPYNPSFEFPRDHASHPEYKIEWWYLIGHLNDPDGREYGFQVTFFRVATRPWDPESVTNPEFDDAQVFMTHVALTDVDAGVYHSQERLNRAGWDALARTDTLFCRNGNWTLEMTDPTPGRERLQTTVDFGSGIRLDLSLEAVKQVVAFGDDRGLSIKGPRREDCSLYLTFPRLRASGSLSRGSDGVDLTGEAWMDHEISSSQLGDDLAGWDWTCIQLQDHWEVKAYILRDASGQPSAFSRLIWISPDNTLTYLGPDEFSWRTLSEWESPETGNRYPTQVEIRAAHPESSEPQTFVLTPKVAQQEFVPRQSDITYWEGACRVTGPDATEVGQAYLELTGYGSSLAGKI
jgi:predicted secreted hydrolase